jgi:hypothetical protein
MTTPHIFDPKLEAKHLAWIIDWALEQCATYIERCERDIVRHRAFINIPERNKWGYSLTLSQSRQERIVDLENFLDEYNRLHAWLANAKSQLQSQRAEKFAEEIAKTFGRKP